MSQDPIRQGPLEPYIAACLLRLYPLMLEDFLAFGLKLPIKRAVAEQLLGVPRFRQAEVQCSERARGKLDTRLNQLMRGDCHLF